MAPESVLDAAARRLNEAVMRLEQRLAARGADAAAADLFEDDRQALRAELNAERARSRELEAAASDASAALGRAAVGVRAALGEAANEDA